MWVRVFLIAKSNVCYDSAMMLLRTPWSTKMDCLQVRSSELTTDNSFCVLIEPLKIFHKEYLFSTKHREKNSNLTIHNFKFLISHLCMKSTDQFFQDTCREGNHCFNWTTVLCSKCYLHSLFGLIETPSFLLEYLPEDFHSDITKWQKEKRREKMSLSTHTYVLK